MAPRGIPKKNPEIDGFFAFWWALEIRGPDRLDCGEASSSSPTPPRRTLTRCSSQPISWRGMTQKISLMLNGDFLPPLLRRLRYFEGEDQSDKKLDGQHRGSWSQRHA
ncbi:hypothetical protein F2Q68_00028147 [Brassica cretica]|uniref:Uncharacterized protein n=1 Tax=Brassica cretica TaxID=69181 RepID=A0A8S9I8R2_BRACR|nr:hypothetical protein F2Q68_00028147 [Brassica cretica]